MERMEYTWKSGKKWEATVSTNVVSVNGHNRNSNDVKDFEMKLPQEVYK